MVIHAYAAKERGAPLQPFTYDEAPLGPYDVEVAVSHCGLCHSDIHLLDNDWGNSKYPLVPGHEIVGKVTEKGEQVTGLEVGQRVGVGWQRSSCLTCDLCICGDENLCTTANEATCLGHFGGFADKIRVDGRFAFVLPEGLPSETAAPLLCGGATVYSPLHIYGVRPPMRVGVVGIGGLGHLAIQFAAAYGCEVLAFSSSKEKEAEAKRFGAKELLSSKDPTDLKQASGSIDYLIYTAPVALNWQSVIDLLRPNGTLCFVGVVDQPVHFGVMSLIGGNRRVVGSCIGGRPNIREMLHFASRHGITAMTEALPLSEVNQAIEKVKANKARYRMVLKV